MKYRVKSLKQLKAECTEIRPNGDLYFAEVSDCFLGAMYEYCNTEVEISVLNDECKVGPMELNIYKERCIPVGDLVYQDKSKEVNKNEV